MQELSKNFLTSVEEQAVTSAVQEAEKRTSGEIVPMIVSASHHYPMAAAIGGLFFAVPLALLLTYWLGGYLWLGSQNMYLFLAVLSLIYFPLRWLVNSIPAIKRLFLSARDVEEEVQEAAITSFFGEELYKTRDDNGILIFISVLEQKVWLLADSGINERLDPEVWQDVVADLTSGIRSGKAGDSLCHAVARVGALLEEHFPYQKDDRDELHNLIIR